MPRPIATTPAERIATIIEAAERAAAAVVDNAEANAQAYLDEAQAEADRIVAARLASLSDLTDSLVAQAEAVRRQSERLIDSLDVASTQMELPADPPAPAVPEAPVVPDVPESELQSQIDHYADPQNAAGPGFDEPAGLPPVEEPDEDAGLSGGFRLSAVESPPPEPELQAPPLETQVEPPAPEPQFEAQPPAPEVAPAPAPEPPRADPTSSAGARLLATQMAVSGSSREEIDRRLRSGFDIEDTAPILDAILGTAG